MQILITLKNTGIIDIPVNYNYYVQSAIFKLLSEGDAEYARNLHNVAYGGRNKYKFFVFGDLIGKSHFHDKKLYYESDMKFKIRSASDEFIQILTDAISKSGQLCIGNHQLRIKSIDKSDYRITEPLINMRTLSPIVAKRQTDNNRSIYYSPQDVRFIRRIRETFENKYEVFFGRKPQTSVDIMPVGANKKVVTKYKDTWITAYHGVFQLYGATEHLQFLYDVGLGTKTSQGFGMFDVIG